MHLWVKQDSSGAAHNFWEGIILLHRQSLYSLSIFHDPQALLPSAKKYLSHFNGSHTHQAFMVLPCSCSCQNSSVCVATEWLRSRKNSGYERIFAGFFPPTRSNSQLITCPSCTHSNHSQGVKMKLCNISTASELLGGEGILQVFFLANFCPSSRINKIYSTLFRYRSFLMLGNSLQWSCECHHSLNTTLQFTAANPSCKGKSFFPVGHSCVTDKSHCKRELWI